MKIPFVDVRVQSDELRRELSQAIEQVIDEAHFVLGSDVERFEQSFAEYCGVKHGVGVASIRSLCLL